MSKTNICEHAIVCVKVVALCCKTSDQKVKHKNTTRTWTVLLLQYIQFHCGPVTIEGFIPGTFTKYVNNNGECYSFPEQCTAVSKELQLKVWMSDAVYL